jgi:hypothetical protein
VTEPNAALTYGDLILTTAEQLGVAYFGSAGTGVAQVPLDAYELDRVKRFVQDGLRMFMADAPPNGWRWQTPLAQVTLWPEMGIAMPPASAGPTVSAVFGGGVTTVTATTPYFDASMVGAVLSVRDTGLFTIASVLSDLQVTLTGNKVWQNSHTFLVASTTGQPTMTIAYGGSNVSTITASAGSTFYQSSEGKLIYALDMTSPATIRTYLTDTTVQITDTGGALATAWGATARVFNLSSQGVYALPQTFGGETRGEITYLAGSNRGVPINWTHELEIRRLRENWNSVSGNPYYAAVRLSPQFRRWELMIYPNTGGIYVVEFPYIIYFDKIVNLTDVHPAGFAHDETVKAACLAQAELQGEDMAAGRMSYYREIALPNSYRIDSRQAPRRLGYVSDARSTTVALRDFRQYFRRPTVTYRA